ncbi:MAG TPA: metallophosphoesterase family protein [Noviherbaspirillum sp.]|jgi:predicted phosphodiesterase|uniref:metallophosphoesterase family protein n=1 Tax=Noviherbaspirillum sp. TaxID=1926288 RepID=UPI002F951B92
MIALISDIHGNLAALRSVLDRIDAMGITRIVCLGDTAGYYCEINECCDLLRSRGIYSLLGNHDRYVAFDETCPRSNSANVCIEYQRAVITDENKQWLRTLESQGSFDGLNIVHGGWNDPVDEYVMPSEAYFSRREGTAFASGHTHVPCIWKGTGRTYCNPGSVGQPRDGDARASFALWNGMDFSLERVEYDICRTQDAMRAAGFEPYFYENLSIGARIGGKIDRLAMDRSNA